MKDIGFIGLGNMGSKMSIHLAKAGYNVSGFDIDNKLVDKLTGFGIKKENSISEISKTSELPKFLNVTAFIIFTRSFILELLVIIF